MNQTLPPSPGWVPTSVAIIIPAYNAGQWLGETLDRIQAQTFRDWVAIVADDASTDDTPRIVQIYAARDTRFRLLRLPSNSGGNPAVPRNAALAQAQGEWVAFCDADDLWHPRKLELQLEVAATTGADLVCSAIRDFHPPAPPPPDTALPAEPTARQAALRADAIGLWRLLGKNIIPNSSVLCRRGLLQRLGGYDPDPAMLTVEDYDLWLRVLESGGRAVKMRLPLVHYRCLPGSVSSNKRRVVPRVLRLLQEHFRRTGRPWLFPLAAPALMASYVVQAVYLRLWRGRL